MSKFKKRSLIVLACLIAVSAILAIIAKSGANPAANLVNTALSPVQSLAAAVTNPVKNFVTYLTQMKDLKDENEALKSELETLKKESRNQEEYKKENTRLKKLLQLTDDLAACETVPAKIVSFEPGNWFHTLMINKGSNQGIKVSDVVITESGLVGKITEVGFNWAKVSTILDSGNSVGIKLTRTGDVGITEGDAELLKKRRFKLDYISKETAVISGDLLETSGLGGIYPPGLSVGTVEEIQLDNTGEIVKAVISPAVDFDNLYEVVVVTYWEPEVYDREQVMIEYAQEQKAQEDTGTRSDSLAEESDEDKENSSDAASESTPASRTDMPEDTAEPNMEDSRESSPDSVETPQPSDEPEQYNDGLTEDTQSDGVEESE